MMRKLFVLLLVLALASSANAEGWHFGDWETLLPGRGGVKYASGAQAQVALDVEPHTVLRAVSDNYLYRLEEAREAGRTVYTVEERFAVNVDLLVPIADGFRADVRWSALSYCDFYTGTRLPSGPWDVVTFDISGLTYGDAQARNLITQETETAILWEGKSWPIRQATLLYLFPARNAQWDEGEMHRVNRTVYAEAVTFLIVPEDYDGLTLFFLPDGLTGDESNGEGPLNQQAWEKGVFYRLAELPAENS